MSKRAPDRQPTSRDVARLAGVSQPTVSRAFDPEAAVAPETRARVMRAAAQLGYQPNVIARSLSTQRTGIVGVILANLTASQFYPNALEAITTRLQSGGRQVLLFTATPEQPVDDLLHRVLGYQVDGLIIASTTPSRGLVDACVARGTPVVLFNRPAAGSRARAVCCDNVVAARAVAEHLLAIGRRRLAYIAGVANTFTNTSRETGFTEALRAQGHGPPRRACGAYTYASGRAAARELLQSSSPPDAIFCAADIMALGALDAARSDMRLRVPEDVAIAGFDDIPAAAWPAYDLTTVRQPLAALVDAAVAALDAAPAADGAAHFLPGELIVRGTTIRPATEGETDGRHI